MRIVHVLWTCTSHTIWAQYGIGKWFNVYLFQWTVLHTLEAHTCRDVLYRHTNNQYTTIIFFGRHRSCFIFVQNNEPSPSAAKRKLLFINKQQTIITIEEPITIEITQARALNGKKLSFHHTQTRIFTENLKKIFFIVVKR